MSLDFTFESSGKRNAMVKLDPGLQSVFTGGCIAMQKSQTVREFAPPKVRRSLSVNKI